jgi:hypothetical protein
VTTLQNDVKGLRVDVTTLQNDVKELRVDVTALQGDFKSLRSDLTVLRTDFESFRVEVRGEFVSVRTGASAMEDRLRVEIRAGDEETRRQMRVLHEEVISRIALLQEGMNQRHPGGRRSTGARPSKRR